jgi:hypothetical protein
LHTPARASSSVHACGWLIRHRDEQEIIELLVAHAYTNPRPFEEPHNHVAGFLRFLHLLSTFNWEETALVVDIDGEFDYDDHQHIQATYERLRSLQVCILFISLSPLQRRTVPHRC